MKKHSTLLALALAASCSTAAAQGFDQDNLYVGGGLGYNSVSGWDSAIGFQFFAGYELNDLVNLAPVNFSVEAGYMTTGDFEYEDTETWNGEVLWSHTYSFSASGLWVNAVFGYPITPEIEAIGRIGIDLGDDDGLMFGIGAGYTVSPEIQVRAEYVIRDNIDSIQLNGVYRF